MRRFAVAEPRAGWLALVWGLSSVIAPGFIWISLQKNPDIMVLPSNFDTLVAHQDLVVGSSLSLAALPDNDLYANVLNPDRATLVAGLPNISEAHSISILEAAAAASAHTVLLEVNAFAHEYDGLRNHPLAATLAGKLSENGKRLTLVARAAVGLAVEEHARVRVGRSGVTREEFVVVGPVSPQLFPRAVWDTAGLKAALANARRQKTRVLLFWPPLPEGGFGRDRVRYDELRDHISAFAKQYALPLWIAAEPWPDQLFRDDFGHLNASGREHFATEISAWVSSL